MKNQYVYPIVFVGMFEVLAFIGVRVLFPGEDVTVTMGAVTLALGQVATFLINSAQADLASQRADLAGRTASAAKEQVEAVSEQVTQVNDKSSEALVTSRKSLVEMVKSDDLIEFDALADSFALGTATETQLERLIELLNLRKRDDLTKEQLSAAGRMLEIVRKELKHPATKDKQYIEPTPEAVQLSKDIQAAAEVQQIAAGTRKEATVNLKPGETAAPAKTPEPTKEPAIIVAGTNTETVMTLPNVVEAAEKAAESAEKTKELTENVVIEAAKGIEHRREEQEKKP